MSIMTRIKSIVVITTEETSQTTIVTQELVLSLNIINSMQLYQSLLSCHVHKGNERSLSAS